MSDVPLTESVTAELLTKYDRPGRAERKPV